MNQATTILTCSDGAASGWAKSATADLGARQLVWALNTRQEHPAGVFPIEMAASDTAVGFVPGQRASPIPTGPLSPQPC
jgi:hypothetical protein